MIVADASVIVDCLADDGAQGEDFRGRLRSERFAAPELIYLEVAHAVRTGALRGSLENSRAVRALADLSALAIRTFPHRPLLPRIWQLRGNVSAYDASYVALAEALGCALVTADKCLAGAPGLRCEVEVLG